MQRFVAQHTHVHSPHFSKKHTGSVAHARALRHEMHKMCLVAAEMTRPRPGSARSQPDLRRLPEKLLLTCCFIIAAAVSDSDCPRCPVPLKPARLLLHHSSCSAALLQTRLKCQHAKSPKKHSGRELGSLGYLEQAKSEGFCTLSGFAHSGLEGQNEADLHTHPGNFEGAARRQC